MLRRYNSRNLDTIFLKTRRTTIGSAPTCDVVLKGKGIAQIHASIESNSTGYVLKEHSLSGITRVNDRPVFGQVEIHSGDLIQVGGSPPFVFDSEWMFGTRPNSAKMIAKRNAPLENAPETIPEQQQQPILPMISGKKLHQLSQSQQPSFSDSSVKKRSSSMKIARESSASSTESQRGIYSNQQRSIGNNLLQRVVKLQAELMAKDEKIRQLTSINPFSASNLLYYHQPHHAPPFQAPPLFSHQAPPPLQATPLTSSNRQKSTKSFELFAYRAFIGAITSQLRQFNDRVLRHPQRDSAELFNLMCRAVDVPLASRITEIEKYCEAVLIDNDFEDTDELLNKIEGFIRESRREKILELTNELEVLMPLIRDAASNARENIKVCNVFTQWSRQFGDLLRKNSFSATTLFQAIEDLKTQFSEAHMSRHWLPPSITPILRLAALELEKRNGDVTPSTSPRPPAILDRKKSIDMTLDTCISQVETITHEMDYHVVRLINKAKDYSSFQPLDLDTVTRISKLVESLKTNLDQLTEHSFKEDRPNSVLFFEITHDDLKSSIKKYSDAEGSMSSLGSVKKISVAPKISEIVEEEDVEILEERKHVEGEIMRIIGEIGEKIDFSGLTEPSRAEGMIKVDASVLKMLIQQSQRLLGSYEALESEREKARRKRSAPPMILVENLENSEHLEHSEAPICAKPAQNPEIDLPEVPSLDLEETTENPEIPEISTPREEDSAENLENLVENSEKSEILEDLEENSKNLTENSEKPGILEDLAENPDLEASNPEFDAENDEEHAKIVQSTENAQNLTENDEKSENHEHLPEKPGNRSDLAENSDLEASKPEFYAENDEKHAELVQSTKNAQNLAENGEEPENPEALAENADENPENLESQASQADFLSNTDGNAQNLVENPEISDFLVENQEETEEKVSEAAEKAENPMKLAEIDENSENLDISAAENAENAENHVTAVAESENSENFSSESENPAENDENPEISKIMTSSPPGTPESEPIADDSESEDEKSTIRYIPSKNSESLQNSMDSSDVIEEEEVKLVPNGDVVQAAAEDRMSSHLKSHVNTASGKPHITYQYPIRRYFSPPMKRRSKSEDQKIRETLRNRPPFILY
ncbi:FHA domain-containing protein [Caenorhabditis elegans]|uniref:FHA domain-containing protein n=1 Tax=Caenorhabditis elegans TaxID=6239 RepID=Q9N3H4_CAEEL|nr:FHA domain-containing protein [Caenorhabditis elegans]CCD72295.1 FHA domain-containing protein [Caenorhabditis elegans]|eukprot:NP_497674.3 Uncharacterized protein CELE_Y53G8AL.1 [Caenorhabditis elegans]